MDYKKQVESLMKIANLEVGKDIYVNNENFYKDVILGGSLALGESYMRGDWDSKDLTAFFVKILKSNIQDYIKTNPKELFKILLAKTFNMQSRKRAFQVGELHYDIGNELYEKMLDETMAYTCAYFKSDSDTLHQAQLNKFDLICKKIDLKPGMRILDIGCGWGGLMKFASENYGVKCVGLTVSKDQKALGEKLCQGLPVKFLLEDYRNHKDKYDRIVSIGCLEHVGVKNYKSFFKTSHDNLKKDGIFLTHFIGNNVSVSKIDDWIDKYIFRNAILPSIKQVSENMEGFFIIEDIHNIGEHYARTLNQWKKNFDASYDYLNNTNSIKYNEIFKRMWLYYLLSCEAVFLAREAQLWQIVMTKKQDRRTQPFCRIS